MCMFQNSSKVLGKVARLIEIWQDDFADARREWRRLPIRSQNSDRMNINSLVAYSSLIENFRDILDADLVEINTLIRSIEEGDCE